MSRTDQPLSLSRGRKLEPQAKLPTPNVLQHLPDDDVKLLRLALSEPIEFVGHEFFSQPQAEKLLLQPVATDAVRKDGQPVGANDSGIYRLLDEDEPPLVLDPEHHRFLRFNYCRQKVLELLEHHAGRRLSESAVNELLPWLRAVHETREEIVRENVALVLAMAKRTRIVGVDLSDLISEGNLALMRSVNKFDCSRGYRFSTYACRAILKSFSRVASRATRHRGRFPTEFDPALERSHELERRREGVEENCVDELRSIINGENDHLSDVEREVIKARFALDQYADEDNSRGKTLEQVGELIGVTKERVRQIQNKALGKLREALDETVLA